MGARLEVFDYNASQCLYLGRVHSAVPSNGDDTLNYTPVTSSFQVMFLPSGRDGWSPVVSLSAGEVVEGIS